MLFFFYFTKHDKNVVA